jgi:hypothetical protein
MSVTIDYAPGEVTGMPARVNAALAATTADSLTGHMTFSKGAAMQYALSLLLPAEAMAADVGVTTIDLAALATAMATPGADLSTVLPPLGGAASTLNASWPADPLHPTTTKEVAAVYYLAAQWMVRQMADTTHLPPATTEAGPVLLAAESGSGNFGVIPLVAYLVVAALGAATIAAYAWVKHDDAVEVARAQCSIEIERIKDAAQVQAAITIAEAQIKAGQIPNVPDIVAKMGSRAHADISYTPFIAAGGLLGLLGLAWYGHGRRQARAGA